MAGIAQAFIDISPDFSGFSAKLAQGIGFSFGSSLLTVGESFERLGKTALKKFTIPLAIATAANITQFQALEAEINTVLTLFGTAPALVDETFGEMSEGIRRVAEEVGGLERDIAGGLYQTISAGVPVGEAFEFLQVAQMAAMADRAADLETAVDGISTAVNAFSSENLTAARASDILFAGVAVGKTTLDELGKSIGRSAGLAANAGVQFSEFIAVIAEMTKSGVATAEAVSFMRAAITGLLRPSEDMTKIFQDIGFVSAEAAIPVLGLQGAMQAVSEAAGGSTSKLQELLGSSEAVTAVLAVTGEKAEQFARTLLTVEGASGNTQRAFDIMQRGIGRSFGRLTESFDRLGNIFGEMGSKVVKPFIDILGELVSSLVRAFQTLIPLAETVGKGVEKMVGVFDIPIVGGFAKALVIMAIALAGLLGFLAPMILGLGKLLKLFVLQAIVSRFAGAVVFVTKAMALLEVAMAKNLILGKILIPVFTAIETALKFLGIAAGRTALAIVGAFALLAVFAAAAFVAIKVFTAWREAAEEAAKQTDIFGDGVSRLLDAAGIIENDLPKVFMAVEDSIEGVRNKNFRLIEEFKEMKGTLGLLGAGQVLVNVGASFVWKGGTPEEAFDVIQDIATLTGLEVPLSLAEFTLEVAGVEVLFEGINVQARVLGELINDLEGGIDSIVVTRTSPLFPQIAKSLAEGLIAAIEIGETDLMRGEFAGVADLIGDADVMQELLHEVFRQIEEIDGEELGISLRNTTDVDSFFQELVNKTRVPELGETIRIGVDTDLLKDTQIEEAAAASIEAIRNMRPEIEGVIFLTGEQGVVLRQLIQDVDSAFAAANEHVAASQAAIKAGIEAQLPVFAEYTAAVAIVATELGKSADAWAADLQVVADGSASLADNLTPAEIKIFNEQSVADQASFFKAITAGIISDAKTGESTVKELWEDLSTLMSTGNLVDVKIDLEMERIMSEANTILSTGITTLIDTAALAGTDIPAAFISNFNAGIGGFGTAATDWMGLIEDELDATIDGPTITAPTFIGGSTTYTVNVTASGSSNPGQDVNRVLQLVAGGEHLS